MIFVLLLLLAALTVWIDVETYSLGEMEIVYGIAFLLFIAYMYHHIKSHPELAEEVRKEQEAKRKARENSANP
jgi:arginine exporter protein ArgO